MNEKIENDKAFLIANNILAIKNPEAKKNLKTCPDLLKKHKNQSETEIKMKLSILKQYFEDLLPFIKNVKNNVNDITEETFMCAVYLLLSHACQDWRSLFTLAKNGDYGSFTFIRPIKESLALAELFVLDFRKNERKHLDKWFKGDIIGHGACRDAQDEFMYENGMKAGEIKDMATRLYRMESLPIHGSYITILESISPFTEDFDYDGRTQHFRTAKSLDYAKGTMDGMNISLKLVYKFLVKDDGKYNQLDAILIKYVI